MTTAMTHIPMTADGVTFRAFRGLVDIPGMAAANAALRAAVGVLEPIDVESMRNHYRHLVNSDPLTDCLLASREGGVVGYARTEWGDLVAGDRVHDITAVVEPSAWGHGIGTSFLEWAERRSRAVAAGLPPDREPWLRTWVYDGDDELEAAVLGAGYVAVRREAEMLRSTLEDLPEASLAPGYEIRPVRPEQVPVVWQMLVDAFAEHWGETESDPEHYREWINDPRFRRDLLVVAWAGEQPAAVVGNVVERLPDGSVRGLLDSVATHPDHRRRGLARATIAASLRVLRDEGATSAYLEVDTENHNQALALYESCGFQVRSGSRVYRKRLEPQEDDR